MQVSLKRSVRMRKRRWARLTATVALSGVLSLTSTPICGSVLDTDSLSCCERHGCVPAGIDTAPLANAGRPLILSEASASCESIGFNADACCRMGELTYPAAQIRASERHGFGSMVVLEFIAPATVLHPVLRRRTQQKTSSTSPPPAGPGVQVTRRI